MCLDTSCKKLPLGLGRGSASESQGWIRAGLLLEARLENNRITELKKKKKKTPLPAFPNL